MSKKYLLNLIKNNNINALEKILAELIDKETYDNSSLDDSDKDLQNEKWLKYGHRYYVSNMGRVRYRDTKYVIPQINRLINGMWNLYLDGEKWEKKCKTYNITINSNISNYVSIYNNYMFVWFEEIIEEDGISEFELAEQIFSSYLEKGDTLAIHHINNDEKDNRFENLILIPTSIHSKVHSIAKNKKDVL